MSESATRIPVPWENVSALDLRATSKTSDVSGFSNITFSINQSLKASEHSSSFLISDSDLTATYNCVSSSAY